MPIDPTHIADHITQLGQQIEALKQDMHRLHQQRCAEARTLHEDYGWSYAQIAKALGVGRARAQQLARPVTRKR